MNKDLEELTKLMPPPPKGPYSDVDFPEVERQLGIEYPPDFKEFISVYGASIWCDHVSLRFPRSHKPEDVEEFKVDMSQAFSWFEGNTYDAQFNPIVFPKYPEKDGLFLFAEDFSGDYYCWITKGEPARWPILCWFRGGTAVVDDLNMTQMFLGWLQRTPKMVDLWGNLDTIPKERISLRYWGRNDRAGGAVGGGGGGSPPPGCGRISPILRQGGNAGGIRGRSSFSATPAHVESFFGRPRGRRVHSRPRRIAVRTCHSVHPIGPGVTACSPGSAAAGRRGGRAQR